MDTRRLSSADTRLAAKYDVIEDHGSYLIATDKQTHTRKLLYVIELCDVKGEERKWAVIDFINEYKGLHLLPCMVRLGESFRDQEVFYVAQEVVKYGTLREECAQSQAHKVPLEEDSIKLWLCQILLSLHALHMRKVVHGAVTLSNVYLTGKDDNVRLGPTNDFLQLYKDPNSANHQISTFKTARGMENPSDVSGKFHTAQGGMECLEHLAPEMFNATGEVNYSNDVWALGVLAFKLATYEAPFAGNTPVQVVMSIQKNEPNWDLLNNKGYSQEFISVVKEMLVKDPNERATCRHLLNMEYFPAAMNFG